MREVMTTPVPIRAEASDIEYLLDDGMAVHGVGDGGIAPFVCIKLDITTAYPNNIIDSANFTKSVSGIFDFSEKSEAKRG